MLQPVPGNGRKPFIIQLSILLSWAVCLLPFDYLPDISVYACLGIHIKYALSTVHLSDKLNHSVLSYSSVLRKQSMHKAMNSVSLCKLLWIYGINTIKAFTHFTTINHPIKTNLERQFATS